MATLLLAPLPVARAQGADTGRYIVVLKAGTDDPQRVARDHARRYEADVSFVYDDALRGFAATIPEHRIAALRADSRVAYVDVDAPLVAFGHTAGSAPTGVHRAFAPDNVNLDIDGFDDRRIDADIAILDTGIDLDHPDLSVAGGKNCSSGLSYDDGNGHGTHVAGTAAGLDRGTGAVGMAPGARLWAVRVLDNSGSGSWSSVICGIDWVTGRNTDKNADGTLNTSNDIEVANMSLGGSGSDGSCASSSLHQAICNSVASGATYAVAAGNSSADANNQVPATYAEVMTVSALADFDGLAGGLGPATCRSDTDDTFANFSNYGADVDVIAPGVCIRSTWRDGGYNTISGTSMASPHVAGAAALYKERNPTATPSQVQTAIQAAGNFNWSNADDKDGTKEPLVDVRDPVLFGVSPVNSPPVASDDNASTKVDNAVSIKVLANDSDANGDPLTVTNLTVPTSGTVVLNADNSVTYTPNTGFAGTDAFTYTANDGKANSNVATVTVTVSPNQAPVAGNDSASANKNTAVTIKVLANDSDPNGDLLSVTNLTAPANGTVVLNTDQTVTYTPATGFTGTDSFTYTASDGSLTSNIATVTVTVSENIVLGATGYKVKGLQKADLSWSGTTSSVDIYRDGAVIATNVSGSTYTDHINKNGNGKYTYKVCVAGATTTCSNEATVIFN